MDDDRKWHLAWAQLDAFSKNLPTYVEEKHVVEFHSLLNLLHEATGEDVSPFRIPDNEVKPKPTGALLPSYSGRSQGAIAYSTKKYCDRDLMLRKIDAVYGYFKRLDQPPPPPEKPKYGY